MASEPVARSESFTASIPEFERLIAEVMEEWKVPGLAVVVVQNGEVTFVKPYGLRDVEAGLKVTTDTQFQVMSVSKSFAATGLALLVDEGRVDWKKPVREYIPEFRLYDAVGTERLTVRDFLCHHSGLPRHDWIWLPGDLSSAQMLAAMRYLEPSDDIRSTFQYSNLGYLVASMVAERVSGQGWAEFTRALTDKLHMDVTFTVEELAAAADAAVPYAMEGDTRLRSKLWPVSVTAAGGISTSIASLANWLRFHLGKGSRSKACRRISMRLPNHGSIRCSALSAPRRSLPIQKPTSVTAAIWPITISNPTSCRCRLSKRSAMPKAITLRWRMNALDAAQIPARP
jgi:CubicO group peptidase (beta-lactamase class C family)